MTETELRKLAEAATPGPWEWGGNLPHEFRLQTTHSGRIFVMLFKRMGPQGAQPVFQVKKNMVAAVDLATFEVGADGVVGYEKAKADDSVYRYDVSGIEAPDAKWIAAANPTAVIALLDELTALRAKVKSQAEVIKAIQREADLAAFGEGPVLALREIKQLARRAAQEASDE